jgi:DNA-binding CsgD family transcriptional regulator
MEDRQDTPHLTPRQIEVVQLVVNGLTSQQIARQLWLSPRTVENHIALARERARLPNRAALVYWALKHGLVA